MPASWYQVDPSSAKAAEDIQRLVTANPGLKPIFGSGAVDLASTGIVFIAVETGAGAEPPAIDIAVKPAVGATASDLPLFESAVAAVYKQIGGVVSGTDSTTMDGQTVLQIKAELGLPGIRSGRRVSETQDLLAANDSLYVITFVGDKTDETTIESTFKLLPESPSQSD